MKTYRYTVSAIGYETTTLDVQADTKQQAAGTNNRLRALLHWCKINDVDADTIKLPHVELTLLKNV